MAMIDIEYRYAKDSVPGGDFPGREIRRTTVKAMEEYLRGLVYEMQEADISAKYIGKETEDENMVYINGMKVNDILRGLEIKMLDPEEDTCGCSGPRPITIGRPSSASCRRSHSGRRTFERGRRRAISSMTSKFSPTF